MYLDRKDTSKLLEGSERMDRRLFKVTGLQCIIAILVAWANLQTLGLVGVHM